MGATGVLESAGSISGTFTASTRIISRFCAADTACAASISGFDTAGTACTRGSVLLILPVLAVFSCFFLLSILLSSFWASCGLRCRPFSPPGTCLQFLSPIGSSIPTARRLSSNVANSRSRAFRESFCAQEKVCGPSVVLIPPVLAVFRPPALECSQYSKYEMCSILRVYSEHEVY